MKRHFFLIIGCIFSMQLMAQTGIGTTTPDPSAKLEVNSITKGFLPPRMTSAQRVAISSPAAGLMVYQSDGTAGLYYYTGSAWVYIINSSNNVLSVSNGGTGSNSGSITGSGALTFAAGGSNQSITLTPSGTGNTIINNNVGMGTTAPIDRLDVRSAMSVNEIKFRGTDGGDDSDPYRLRKFKIGTLNELQLHLNDDYNERFAIYGNSCLLDGCAEYSSSLYHYFRSDGNVYHAGNVGIGTTSPAAPLHVASYATQSVGSYGYLNTGGANTYTINGNVNYSIQAEQRIRAPEFNAISDVRIKTDIVQLNTIKQLAELNKLNVVNYAYIDKLSNGNKTKTGFIAQQVEDVNAQFVNQSTDFIPSVYALAKSATLNNGMLQVSTEKSHGLVKGDIVKLYVEGRKEVIKTIEAVLGPDHFSVMGWEDATNNLFVYGKKVTDFRAIDFDQITALSVAAIQELSKKVDQLEVENTNLKKSITEGIEARLLKLEAKLNQ
ncbi:MAG: tail fiber domain-containing protein [Sediminibacterium sp.]|nr:tail fiber domain-containing protein [Sediminibacterium sp.]MBP6459398.1 tail fiber domain-containing protein [Crocinitomicaceae bacterium]